MKTMKKIVKVLLISLMILVTFTVNAIADDDYQTVYDKYFTPFGKSPTGPGQINRVMVYVSVPDGVDPAKVGLEKIAYNAYAGDPTYYCVGYYPTVQRIPWAEHGYSDINSKTEIQTLLGQTPFSRDSFNVDNTDYSIRNTSFDENRMSFDVLKYAVKAALGDGVEAFSGSCWHLNVIIKNYIFKAVSGETEVTKQYVEEGLPLPALTDPECTSEKHFVKWECKDWNNVEYTGTTMPKKDITATAVFENHKFDSYELTENGHREKCSTCSYLKEETAHSYNEEGVCVCGDTSYVLTNLKNEVWTSGSDETVVFSSNANYGKFEEVKIDGTVVDSGNYDVYEGSTVVELKSSYLSTLSAGEHSIEVVSYDGSCSGKFTVKVKPAPVVPTYVAPKTGID